MKKYNVKIGETVWENMTIEAESREEARATAEIEMAERHADDELVEGRSTSYLSGTIKLKEDCAICGNGTRNCYEHNKIAD